MGKLTFDTINWGDWGTFSYDKFLGQFRGSKEFMNTPFGSIYDLETAINEFVFDIKTNKDSLDPGIFFALHTFATNHVPQRLEDYNRHSVVSNPQRDNREGARPSIPAPAPDIFKWILEGDKVRGHAIVADFDQETRLGNDNLYTCEIDSRELIRQNAHAVSIVNKFPAYIRIIDDKLVRLLDKIGFLSNNKFREGKPSHLKTLPYGLNFVSFPFEYSDTLSNTNLFNLYSTMKAAQSSLLRGINVSHNPHYDVFFNIGCLAGGTIPRIHIQTYLRTKKHPEETYDYKKEGQYDLNEILESDRIKLNPGNRSWNAYVPQVRIGKFDLKLELKKEKHKNFLELNDIELWDISELLIYNSNVLDQLIGISERNIQFFPSGVMIRPFTVDGGHEKITNEMIHGQTAYQFGKRYDETIPLISKETFEKPKDKKGNKKFCSLVDESSPIFKLAV